MTRSLPLLVLLAGACTPDNELRNLNDNEGGEPTYGDISGRACDPSGVSWLAGATVYVNVMNAEGYISEIISTTTDAEGYWTLVDVPTGQDTVVYIQKGNEVVESHDVDVVRNRTVTIPEPTCFDPQELKIALIAGNYDDFDRVLENMGISDYTMIDGLDRGTLVQFLSSQEAMAEYDMIFFNGGHVEEGVVYDHENPSNPDLSVIRDNLKSYLDAGGRVYASDWAYDWVAQIWPDKVDFLGAEAAPNDAQLGTTQRVDAIISDYALAEFMESEDQTFSVLYDLPVWPPIAGAGSAVSVHLTGTIEYRESGTLLYQYSSPLLVSFNVGLNNGKVVFSTFRLVANNNQDLIRMMQYVMFAL